MRAMLTAALAASLWLAPIPALAGAVPAAPDKRDNTLAFGLTATQLAIAAAVGVGAGATGALVSSNVIAGASLGLGTLAAIYVGHLAVEAIVVGGVYYWWPWDDEKKPAPSHALSIRGPALRDAAPGLRLSR